MTLVILNDCGNEIRWEIRLFDRSVCEVVVDVDAIDDLEAVDDVDAVDVAFTSFGSFDTSERQESVISHPN